MIIISDQAMNRSAVIDRCYNQSKIFVDHFLKVMNDYESDSSSLDHHIQEMQACWDNVKNIVMKHSGNKISVDNLMDWFFTQTRNIEEIIPDIYSDYYEKLIVAMLNNRDSSLKEIIDKIMTENKLGEIALNEMSLPRADAIDVCMGLGKQFINHYKKLSNNDQDISHHIQEMQSWWDKVRSISLKPNNRKITDINLVDWFFTAGGNVEDYLDENLTDKYNSFIVRILNNKDEKLINLLDM